MDAVDDIKRELSNAAADQNADSFVVMFSDDTTDIEPDSKSDKNTFVEIFDEPDSSVNNTQPSDNNSDSFVVLFDQDQESSDTEISTQDGDKFKITFPRDIRIQNIVKLKSDLMCTLDANEITYDASNVELLDTASIQLIKAHELYMTGHSVPVSWVQVSEKYSNTAKILGINFS